MSIFNEEVLEKKLLALKDTHESIAAASAWCLEQPQHHKKVVSVWLQVLKQVKIQQRLTLFYLANDVIQYSKRKGFDFAESWGPALQKATTMVRDDKLKKKILRIFQIWEERSIYDEAFLSDLSGLLSSHTHSQSNQDAQDFQPSILIAKIRSCKALEDDTDLKRKIVNESHLSLNDADALHSSLKDRRHGADLEEELEEGVAKMESFIDALKAEIKDRNALIDQLDLGEAFYEIQRGEAKVVCNAYRNFSKRVEMLKKKLDELTNSLPSPVPSPDINAPSPSPESDIDLPDDPVAGRFSAATSFIGSIDPEQIQQLSRPSEDIFSLLDSPRDETPPRKMKYKPPTPPRNFKRKLASPKSYSPVPTYISSATPTLSSSSASNYSPTPYSGTKPNVYTPPPTTTAYTIPAVTSYNQDSRYSASTTYAQNDTYSYDPQENDDMNPLFSNNSSDSYQVPGSNPPPPSEYQEPSPSDYHNPPPPGYQNPPPPPDYQNPPAPRDYGFSDRYESSRNQYQNPPPPAVPANDFSVPPPPTDFSAPPRPFYSSNNELPPLLGEECPPPPINGFNAFLKGNSSLPNATSPAGFSSFMGNMSLPFDFQKGLFSDDTPSSPPPENLIDDSTSQLDAYFSNDSTNDAEGKPIEVINRTKQPDLSDILKVITMRSEPVPPPPQPPPPALDINAPPPMLPPKFPTWGQSDWSDTPASPPLYEKSGFVEPVEFDETDGDDGLALETDTDLRTLGLSGDIDHRNLISLTSSPRDTEPAFPSSQDTDYRKMALIHKKPAPTDITESVDMEMSSDEEAETETAKSLTSVSFLLSTNNKALGESPLKENEEPNVKKLTVPLSPPPRMPEPPPLPNVEDIFPDLDSGDENKEPPTRIPSPPKPPMPLLPSPVQSIPSLQDARTLPSNNFNQQFHNQRPQRGFFNPRFNNQRQRFNQPWQNNAVRNQNGPRERQSPMVGPRFRPDGFRGRPNPWFGRGNQRPQRFTGWPSGRGGNPQSESSPVIRGRRPR